MRKLAKIIGVVGCSGSGKSTFCEAAVENMKRTTSVKTIRSDDFYLPVSAVEMPRFELAALPWAAGVPPLAFVERGKADYDHPDAVNWAGLKTEVTTRAAADSSVILVDSLLLLADHPTANALRNLCYHIFLLHPSGDELEAQRELIRRKWSRPRDHLGQVSYRDRGVEFEDFAMFWREHVWPRWVEHGLTRSVDPTVVDPARMTRLDCMRSVDDNVQQALSSGIIEPG